MVTPLCEPDIVKALLATPARLLHAITSGSDSAHAEFDRTWSSLSETVEHSLAQNTLSVQTVRLALAVTNSIQSLATRARHLEHESSELHDRMRSDTLRLLDERSSVELQYSTPETRHAALPFAWVRPLFQYILDNICSPYPTFDDKQRLMAAVSASGWTSVTQKKIDDWMNMTRTKMGYTLILKSSAVGDDRNVMEDYIRRVIYGSAADRSGIPESTVCSIKEMHEWILDHYDTKSAKEQTGPWAQDILDLVQRLSDTAEPPATYGSPRSDDEDEDYEEEDDDDFFSDEDDSGYSDNTSLSSDTDVDEPDDCIEPSTSACSGIKRKYLGLKSYGYPISRTSSSSSLRSRVSSSMSCRSSSSISSGTTAVDSEEDFECDRPSKRRRSSVERDDLDLTKSSSPCTPQTTISEGPRVQKRKLSSLCDDSPCHSPKRQKRCEGLLESHVSTDHLAALQPIGQMSWSSSSLVAHFAVGLELDSFVLDGSPVDLTTTGRSKETDTADVYCRLEAHCCDSRDVPSSPLCDDASTRMWTDAQLRMLDSFLSDPMHLCAERSVQQSTTFQFTVSHQPGIVSLLDASVLCDPQLSSIDTYLPFNQTTLSDLVDDSTFLFPPSLPDVAQPNNDFGDVAPIAPTSVVEVPFVAEHQSDVTTDTDKWFAQLFSSVSDVLAVAC